MATRAERTTSKEAARWRRLLLGDDPTFSRGRRVWRRMPGEERCRNCRAPLTGWASFVTRAGGRKAYERNPRFCNY